MQWSVGDVHTCLEWVAGVDLTQAQTVTLSMAHASGYVTPWSGPVWIDDPLAGRVYARPASTDVAVAGAFFLRIRVVFADGTVFPAFQASFVLTE